MEKKTRLSFTSQSQNEVQFAENLCIICQESTETTVTSSEVGRERVTEAAQIRDDVVLQRINISNGQFVYHSNNKCYKIYTMKKTLEYIQQTKANKEKFNAKNKESEGPPMKRMR